MINRKLEILTAIKAVLESLNLAESVDYDQPYDQEYDQDFVGFREISERYEQKGQTYEKLLTLQIRVTKRTSDTIALGTAILLDLEKSLFLNQTFSIPSVSWRIADGQTQSRSAGVPTVTVTLNLEIKYRVDSNDYRP